MKFELGSSPDAWGVWFPDDPHQPPFERFLDEVSRSGYRTIELGPYGYLPTDPAVLRSLLDSYRLRLSAGFIFGDLHGPDAWEQQKSGLDSACALLETLGAEFLVLIEGMYTDLYTGELVANPEMTETEWVHLTDLSNRIGEYVSDRYGLRVAFHPHAQTVIEREDQIEHYLEMTDPSVVSIVLDTGHHAYCGGDPVAFMRNHHDRIPYLHIKSVDRGIRAEVAREGIPFAEAVKMGVFSEPRHGVVDFVALKAVLDEVGFVGIGIVEHDQYPADLDRLMPVAVSTRSYLTDIGLGGEHN